MIFTRLLYNKNISFTIKHRIKNKKTINNTIKIGKKLKKNKEIVVYFDDLFYNICIYKKGAYFFMREKKNNSELNGSQNSDDLNTLPGLDQQPMNDTFILPGMDGNNMQDNMNQNFNPYQGMDGQFGDQNQNMNMGMNDSMNPDMGMGMNDPMNPDGNFNPYQGMDGQFVDQNQNINMGMNDQMNSDMGMGMNDPMNPDANFNPYQGMDGQFGDQNQNMNMGMNDPMNPNMGMGMNDPMNQNMGMGMNDPMNPDMGMGMNDQMNPNMGMGMNDPMNPNMGMGMNDPMNPNMGMDNGQNFNGYQDMSGDNSQGNNDYSGGDEQFVKNWMGKLYEKAQNKKFNWCAAFFRGAYLLYRKMYVTGIIVFILEAVLEVMACLIMTKNPIAGAGIFALVSIGLFIGMGLGFYRLYKNFINGKLNSYRSQTADENQLMEIANQKGGTSVIAVVLYYLITSIVLPVVLFLVVGAAFFSIITGIFGQAMQQPLPTNDIVIEGINEISETPVEETGTQFNFYENYYITYDSDWFLNDKEQLTKGEYYLKYYTSYTKEQTHLDLTSEEGQKKLVDLIIKQYSEIAEKKGLTVETGNQNFATQNNSLYNYVDFVADNAIERVYFIIYPDDNILFQFDLTVEGTTEVDNITNVAVIDIITNIGKDESNQSEEPDEENEIAEENLTEQSENEIENATISNDVTDALSNSTTDTNTANQSASSLSQYLQ